jgi:GNAT superfamily N-acetyltransferase
MRSWKLPKTARWALALIVPGVLWAFAHMGYVRDPIYMRGIELTIAAVFLEGLFFLAFDLTTTLVAHFAFNAALTAFPLLRSNDPYFVLCGAVVFALMATPLVPGLVRAIRRRARGEAIEEIPLSVSPATAEDIEPLTALPKPQVDWAALLADPRAVVHCLRAGQEVGGVAAGRLDEGKTGQVVALYVAPAWRRRYAGSTLVDQLVLVLQELGAERIQVPVGSEDNPGIAFWASQGWWPARRIYTWSIAPAPRRGWRERFRQAWKKMWEVTR